MTHINTHVKFGNNKSNLSKHLQHEFLGVSRVTRDRVRARARAGDGIRIHICQVNRRSVIRTHTYTQYRADRHVCICIGIGSGSINRDKC